MSYIRNINKLATRRLSKLSHYVLEQLDINTGNMMIQSAVVKETQKKNNTQSIVDIVRNGDNISFVTYKNRYSSDFWCNIQQIKKKYDGVLFVMYYKTSVAIYNIPKEEYNVFMSYKQHQHSGNSDEHQIFITNKNIQQLDNYLIDIVAYKNIFD